MYFSLKPGISLCVWGHAVALSIFKFFVSLKWHFPHFGSNFEQMYSYKHVFNGVLTTLNFYNYFLADPNWEIETSR